MARVDKVRVGNALAMSGASTVYTQPYNIGGMSCASFQMRWVGTAVGASGAIKAYVSNVYDGTTAIATSVAAGDWIEKAITGGSLPAGVNGGDGVEFSGLGWTWIILAYTNASGSGTLNIDLSAHPA